MNDASPGNPQHKFKGTKMNLKCDQERNATKIIKRPAGSSSSANHNINTVYQTTTHTHTRTHTDKQARQQDATGVTGREGRSRGRHADRRDAKISTKTNR